MKAKTTILAMALAAGSIMCHADTKTTWRDAQGRIQGSATTDRSGKTTYRDAQGRITGTKTVK